MVYFVNRVLYSAVGGRPGKKRVDALFRRRYTRRYTPTGPWFFLSSKVSIALLFGSDFLKRVFSCCSSPSNIALLPVGPFGEAIAHRNGCHFTSETVATEGVLVDVGRRALVAPCLRFSHGR